MTKHLPLLALAVLLAACGDDGVDGEPCTPSNELGQACGSNAICEADPGATSGTCRELVACDADGGCPDGEGVCNNGFLAGLDADVCLPFVCNDDSDCASGSFCDTSSGTVGACVRQDESALRCLSEEDCGAGQQCVLPHDGAAHKVCVEVGTNPDGTCDYDNQCASGEFCSVSSSTCVAGSGDFCTGDETCLGGEICDESEGVCREP